MTNWMKLIGAITIILASFAGVRGHVAEESSPLQVMTKSVTEDLEAIRIDLWIPVIEGMADRALQESINRQLEERIMSFAAELAAEAKGAADEAKEADLPHRQYQAYTRFDVYGNQETILSVAVTFYQYTGGAHGLSFIETVNVDLGAGRLLTLTDVLPDARHREILLEAIREEIAAAKDYYFPESLNLTVLPDEGNFYIEGDMLVVYYDLYEIAPYATGMPTFKIPLSLLN